MADSDMIRGTSPRAIYPQQQQQQQQQVFQPQQQQQQQQLPPQSPQVTLRPNVNPNLPQGIRAPPSPLAGPVPTTVQQGGPRPPVVGGGGPPSLRRADSKSSIQPQYQGNLVQRPPGPPAGSQPVAQSQPLQRPPPPPQQNPSQVQGRPQNPLNWASQASSQPQQQQPNRPQFQQPGQQQPNRPSFPRPVQQQSVSPGTQPNQGQFRPPYPQQQQQRPVAPQPNQPIRGPSPISLQNFQHQNSSERLKSGQNINMAADYVKPASNPVNNFLNNNENDDDDDVVVGRATTPLKMPPSNSGPDPMTQSQYKFLENKTGSNGSGDFAPNVNRNSFLSEEAKKGGNFTTFTQDAYKGKPLTTVPQGPPSPIDSNNGRSQQQLQQMQQQQKLQQQQHQQLQQQQQPPPPIPPNYDRPGLQRMPSRGAIPLQRRPPDRTDSNESLVVERRNMPPPPSNPITTSNYNLNNNETRPSGPTSSDFRNEVIKSAGGETVRKDVRERTNVKKGDNDSGVDESTQGNDRNGPASPASPLKSPTKIPSTGISRPPSATPSNISRSASRQRHLLKTPEPEPVKKVSMNKVQVGNAPSPNLKAVRSKIGSLDNAAYKPGGGNFKIETKKIEIKATPRIEAKNDKYVPKGGEKKIVSTKLQWNAKSKIGSLENTTHKPGGGDKKIETLKLDFNNKIKPKVGSKDNVKHVPKGGDIKADSAKPNSQIQTHKIEIKAQSKIGSLDNVKHKPGGGDKKIFDDKDYLKNVEHPIAPTSPTSQSPIPSSLTSSTIGAADENLNQQPQQQQS